MRTPAGFLCPMKNNNNPFLKPPISVPAQLELLSSRGLTISDNRKASHYLKFISYYRFCGYGIEFEDSPVNNEKRYFSGTTFEKILDRYVFDRRLRLLVIDAIERIEVALRTVINNELSLKHGAHWYMNENLFVKRFKHKDFIENIKKETGYKREVFIQHYYSKYTDPKLPPGWMIAEILSLGSWSLIFSHLQNREDQKNISAHFSLNYRLMSSWLHSLTYLRNLCAHHSKLYDRTFTLKPVIAKEYQSQLKNNDKFSAQAAMLKIFLNFISPESNWGKNLLELLKNHSDLNLTKMGFCMGFEDDQFWA